MSNDNDDLHRPSEDGDIDVKTKPETQEPARYKVLLLNDDYTPMEFVIEILQRFFGINQDRAVELMLTVHKKGLAIVGVYPYEIAETKVTQVLEYAKHCKQPLQCRMEKD